VLLGKLDDKSEALVTFRKAVDAGYKDIRLLNEFMTDEKEGIAGLAGTRKYEEVRAMVKGLEVIHHGGDK
jgi:hypothetical protein